MGQWRDLATSMHPTLLTDCAPSISPHCWTALSSENLKTKAKYINKGQTIEKWNNIPLGSKWPNLMGQATSDRKLRSATKQSEQQERFSDVPPTLERKWFVWKQPRYNTESPRIVSTPGSLQQLQVLSKKAECPAWHGRSLPVSGSHCLCSEQPELA